MVLSNIPKNLIGCVFLFLVSSLKGLIYMYMHVYFHLCSVLSCFVWIFCMYIVCIYMYEFMHMYICMLVYMYVFCICNFYVCMSGIYPSNFDVRLTAQKTQSSN